MKKTEDKSAQAGNISEFKNQLTQKEIIKGLIIYINKKLLNVILLLTSIVFILSFTTNNNILLALFLSICITIFTELFLFFLLKQQFSTEKIATYKLYDNCLEIINSNSISHTYEYGSIQSIETKDIIVLFLPKNSFAIIAKRHINAEQIEIFNKIFSQNNKN